MTDQRHDLSSKLSAMLFTIESPFNLRLEFEVDLI
jgi:hypothetical protein